MIDLVAATNEMAVRGASGQISRRLASAGAEPIDAPNLANLYAQFGGAIHRLALGSTHDAAEADDVCQEIWLRVHRDLAALHDAAAARSWLFRLAQRICVDSARRRCVAVESVDAAAELAAPEEGEPERRALSLDQRSLGWEALAWLPERQQAALILRERSECSYEELARVMDSTVPAIEALLFRSRRNLLHARRVIEASTAERCRRAKAIRAKLETGAETPARRIATLRHSAACMRCTVTGRARMSVGAWLGALLRPAAELPLRFLSPAGFGGAPISALIGSVVTISAGLAVASSDVPPELWVATVASDMPVLSGPPAHFGQPAAGESVVGAEPAFVPAVSTGEVPTPPPVLSAVPVPSPVDPPVVPADEANRNVAPGPFFHPGGVGSGGGSTSEPAPATDGSVAPDAPIDTPPLVPPGAALPEVPVQPDLPPQAPPPPLVTISLPPLPPLPLLPIELPGLPPLPDLNIELSPLPPLPPLPALPPLDDIVGGLPGDVLDPPDDAAPDEEPLGLPVTDLLPEGLPDVEDLPNLLPPIEIPLGKLLPF